MSNLGKSKVNVVVIDDDKELLQIINRMLTKLGYSSFLYSEGIVAAAEILQHSPDILICDLVLQDTNGLDVINTVLKKIPTLSVILITGYNLHSDQLIDWEVLKYSHKNAKFVFVNKPFGYEDLKNSLIKVIE